MYRMNLLCVQLLRFYLLYFAVHFFSTEVTFARGCNGKWNSEILMVIILFDQHLCEVVYIPLFNLSYIEVGWKIFENLHRLPIRLD